MTINSATDHGFNQVDPTCSCGSGLERYPLKDAAGIFCAYVCEKCKAAKRSTYNPTIFASGTSYAGSGDEEDIYDEFDSAQDSYDDFDGDPRDEDGGGFCNG